MSALTGFRTSPQQASAWHSQQRGDLARSGSWLQVVLDRPLDPALLEGRLQALVAQEEILRTELRSAPGMALPIQVIHEEAPVPLTVEDWRSCNLDEQEARIARLRQAPSDSQPLQVAYVQTAADRWLLLLKGAATHLDLRSLDLIVSELLGAPTPERLQYVDYAEWKHTLLEEDPDNEPLRFWQQARPEDTLEPLPGLQQAAAGKACQPAIVQLGGAPARQALEQAARQAGMALEEFLFAAWSTLLARLRGQARVQVTWIDEGRGEGLEQALGLYEQRLPIQVDVDLAAPLSTQADSLLRPLRQARGWQDHYDNGHGGELVFAFRPSLQAASQHLIAQAWSLGQRFTLGVECREQANAEGLDIRLAYDQSRLAEDAVACLAEQWTLLLHGLCDAGSVLGAVPLVGERQWALLRAPASAFIARDIGVLELIEQHVRQHPDTPALADAQGVIRYGELGARADALAGQLTAAGVRPGDVVGILLGRGQAAIIAMLAAWKAGATYLPLDPSYPADRLAYMIEDSRTALLLSQREHQALLPGTVRHLLLDELEATAGAAPQVPFDGQRTAYLIYTSGSSGQPKGVPISHANLSHSTQARLAFYAEPVRAYLLLSSFAFDSSVAGIYWTLCQGGLLVLPASGEELDLAALIRLIDTHRVSHSLSLPSLYETLLDYAEPRALVSLRTWVVAGEPCPPRVLEKQWNKAPHVQLVNEYGPTEATVWATADVLDPDSPITIGKPIPGMGLWVLNEQNQPAAVGEPGEIHLGGPSLSSGYLGQPEQTARAFVRHPHVGDGERLYRTGDLARYRADGRLDFLGRRDHQIKIRGYRVEQGEIERVLRSHSEVREAAVIARKQDDNVRLVAYFTDRHGYAPAAAALASYLQDRLPAYMVPSAFVHLDALPHTPNGKLDLNALPDPDRQTEADAPYLAPRTDMETALVDICQQVLKRERVGVLDSFFQIGGDSILSLQIVSRANQQGIRISAKQIFECETIERLAQVAQRIEPGAIPESPETRQADGAPRSAADFPLANLDDGAFDDLLEELNAAD
ncbi:amino acid adenylation domain-containing protein [Pseudomonas sp. GD03944]|uniref:non-ribosomal peptide synthetase n=1 Tax=Pseudomonas sp. GD03944 TaxID=2975409 RepID=UPI00244A5A09|nr:amino acid adenylation domain-containing protein [Pseudomonas sp. GD03944]MDH1265248.1 amino acid adenylation domain-containing protein [Pseudomonas sp. GD03944]